MKHKIPLTTLFFLLGNVLCAKPELRFDIHKVLVQPSSLRLSVLLGGIPELLYVAMRAKLIDPLCYQKATDNQKLMQEALTLYYSGDVSGECFYHLFKKYRKDRLANMVYGISSSYYPTPGIESLIKILYEKGYTLRPASNIGSIFYKKLSEKIPSIFTYFSEGKTVEFINKEGGYNHHPTKKPDKAFFVEFDQQYPPQEKVIFIDDNEANCKVAQQHGWDAIHFKSVQQLEAELEQRVCLAN